MFIKKIICGNSRTTPYTLFLDEKGTVYGCGKIGSKIKPYPEKFPLNIKPQSIHTTYRYTFFINFDKKICIYMDLHQNKNNQIKLPDNTKFKSVTTYECEKNLLCFLTKANSCLFLEKSKSKEFEFSPSLLNGVQQAFCGERHIIYWGQDNKLYAQGCNGSGQCGISNIDNYHCDTPVCLTTQTKILPKKAIKKISVGRYHNIILTYDDKAYGWGNNYFGQLGLGDINEIAVQTLISTLKDKKVENIYTGGHQSFFVTTSNKIYACGLNDDGRLGIGSFKTPKSPTVIAFFYKRSIKIVDIICGYFQTFFITDQGLIYGCGFNENGELGVGDTENKCVPTLIPNLSFRPQKDSFENKLLRKVEKRTYSDLLIHVKEY